MAVVKLGFFTRLLERAGATDRYRFAAEQARHAELRGLRRRPVRPHSGLRGGPTPRTTSTRRDTRVWQATFSSHGGTRAGVPGHGLLLSRTQPRPEGEPDLPLEALQQPIVDAYLAALPQGVAPRILASRTLLVTDTEAEAKQYLQDAWERYLAKPGTGGFFVEADSARTWARRTDTHIGTPDQVVASLLSDPIIPQSTEVAFQVHSIDPGHDATMRSLELIAQQVAPALGWAQAPVTGKQAATPPASLGSHDRMGSEIGY
jgi:hypothetical protein